jgi:hypothetical protein
MSRLKHGPFAGASVGVSLGNMPEEDTSKQTEFNREAERIGVLGPKQPPRIALSDLSQIKTGFMAI